MVQISEQLFGRLVDALHKWRVELNHRHLNLEVTPTEIDLSAIVPEILAISGKKLSFNQPSPRNITSHDDTSDPNDTSPVPGENLTRVGPLPEDEPGYGSQRSQHRHLPDHLSQCPAQLGGACTCPPSPR